MELLAIFDAQSLFSMVWDHMSYFYVFLFMTIESSFIPFPSEIVVPPAAYIASVDGTMNIYGVGIAATLGALAGSIINYFLAVWIGRPIVYAFARSRMGAICMISPEKVKKAEDYFDAHGAVSTFVGRLIPVIRQLISIPAGLARMNFGKFCLFTTLGAAIWNAVLCWLGWFLARFVSKDDLFQKIEEYNQYLSWAGYALGAICILFVIYQLVKPKKQNDSDSPLNA
ncbi:MAG: DedA family protein [Bacteroides sp.]|nr:DedA family protein [Bacteroides sp.]MDE6034118.1 DedA family protein [Muribaculaceae bacterium]MBD5294675.1 DedA family protein [Bacteroides sp.]MBD5352431.1 DedA family protein [Bacteroides sp.]MBD5359217.1 DedA family protein [Bacteroides sp.]